MNTKITVDFDPDDIEIRCPFQHDSHGYHGENMPWINHTKEAPWIGDYWTTLGDFIQVVGKITDLWGKQESE